MTFRRFYRPVLSLALGMLPLPGCSGGLHESAGQGARASRPNIVWIVVDTLRKDHVSCYGYDRNTTPHIDALAAAGVRYENALSQAPWTTPSIGALLTSRYPSSLGIRNERSAIDDGELLISEILREQGYSTGAVVSHSFCSAEWNFDQGFDSFDQSNIVGNREVTSPGVTDRGVAFLEDHRSEPFFLFLHYFDPHSAYLFHPEFDPSPHGTGPAPPLRTLKSMRNRLLPPGELEEVIRCYDSEIAFTDHHIGRLLDRLRGLGLFEDSMIVFTSDHGEEFRDHGGEGHAHTLYRELIDVPLIVKYPSGAPGVVRSAVALVDLYPTVLDMLGLSPPHGMAGRSLLSATPDGEETPRTIFMETSRRAELRGAVLKRRKLIEVLGTGRFELYDLVADPVERVNLAGDASPDWSDLRHDLEAWQRELARDRSAGREVEPTPEQIERLRSLGYIE